MWTKLNPGERQCGTTALDAYPQGDITGHATTAALPLGQFDLDQDNAYTACLWAKGWVQQQLGLPRGPVCLIAWDMDAGTVLQSR